MPLAAPAATRKNQPRRKVSAAGGMFPEQIAFQWTGGVRGPECEDPRDPFSPESRHGT